MRILFLHQFNFVRGWGGSASMLCALHGALSALGHRVEVMAAQERDPLGITTWPLPFDRLLTFGPEKRAGEVTLDELSTAELREMAACTARHIEERILPTARPDLVLANHVSLMALVAFHLQGRCGLPFRLISYGTDTKLLLNSARDRELYGPAARGAERLFTISAFVAGEVEATVGGRIEVLGGAVDPALFFLPPPEVVPEPGRLIYFGRLVTEKGIWVLLDAIERQSCASELVIVGEGPLRGAIDERLARHSPARRVRCLGPRPQAELRAELLRAEAALVPSTWQEPLGLVVLEALACGVPVIASEVGGIPEMIKPERTGLLVPGGDSAALACAIDRLLGQRDFRDRMRANIRASSVPTYRDLAMRLIR